MTNLVKSVIRRNNEDMKRINLILKSVDKFKIKEIAYKIQNLLIEETMKLTNLNKILREYLKGEKNEKI